MTDWSTLKKLIWLRIIKGGGSAARTVKGAIVHVINALARPAISVKCEVNPIQDLHGYDSPWPAGGGVNLLDTSKRSASSAIGYGCTFSIDTNNVFRVTGTVSQQYPRIRFLNLGLPDLVLPAGTYKLVRLNQTGNFSPRLCDVLAAKYLSTTPVTLTEETTFTTIISGTALTGETIDCSFQLMVVDGNAEAPTTYSPFSNICPISGRTSATVTRTGINWYPVSIGADAWQSFNNGSSSNNDGELIVSMAARMYSGVYSRPEAQIRKLSECSVTASYSVYIKASAATEIFIGYANKGNRKAQLTTEYQRFTFDNVAFGTDNSFNIYNGTANAVTVYLKDFQFELGSTASAYEPYAGNTYTIQFGDTVYGGTLDVTNGVLTVDRAMVDLGTLTWSRGGTDTAGIYRFSSNIPTVIAESGSAIPRMLCSQYATVSPNKTFQRVNGVSNNLNIAQVMVFDDAYSNGDVAAFKAAMSGVQLCYELATPLEITLTPTQIDMLLGENNVWADAGDLTLTYQEE